MELNESSARSLTETEKLFVINDLSIINLKFFGVLQSGKGQCARIRDNWYFLEEITVPYTCAVLYSEITKSVTPTGISGLTLENFRF